MIVSYLRYSDAAPSSITAQVLTPASKSEQQHQQAGQLNVALYSWPQVAGKPRCALTQRNGKEF
eukprot:366387-Chlamydomonas_euryale.AAC.6